MPTPDDERRDEKRLPAELSPLTLFLAAFGSVVATLLVSRFGLAGTITGAALTPIVITVARELARRPAERVARLPSEVVRLPTGGRGLVERLPQVRPKVIAATAAAAFAIAVAVFTVPDLIAGESVVADRPSTFFSGGGRGGGGEAPATTTTTTTTPAGTITAPAETVEAPATTAPDTTTAPATTAPPATTPAPPAPAPTPAPEAPVAPAPVPATTAPAVPPPTPAP
ncbi:hypothetical protein [Miltoncostaea marina]|uniref:hypothetical protein n=1 Tax=Miltoncostaea marina TaxID=2843215 RepID=UPI001C3CB182|nr:hypothetical protein [Miltoncostaea marina]